ncbi:MAG TPA: hypothetical protein VG872_11370 [Acidimicrobiia bacterium]|nr:hypothetical protein [Acidimicrobiia bacterium]
MLDYLVERAASRWSQWFPGENSGHPTPLLLAGGPAHGDRVSVLLFGSGRSPRAIMKIGFNPREAKFLEAEYGAMDGLRPQLPAALRTAMPRALDLISLPSVTAMAAEVLPGKRLVIPPLTGSVSRTAVRVMDSVFRRSFRFCRQLAEATVADEKSDSSPLVGIVERFGDRFASSNAGLADAIEHFRGLLSDAEMAWSPAWQHQDVAVGNLLEDGGRLLFLDWEHAAPGCVPWFDVAYTPVATAHLALRVDHLPSIRDAAFGVLGSGTPIGMTLRGRMEEIWDYPLPISWAVTLAGMEGALRRLDDERVQEPEYAELVELLLTDAARSEELAWLDPLRG